ncbi:MAG TPA: hypothetical protein VGM27_30125 [Acidobacteriaceae bacterium]
MGGRPLFFYQAVKYGWAVIRLQSERRGARGLPSAASGMNGPASGLTTLPLGVVALAFFADIDLGQRYFQIYSSDTAATLKNLHISG